MTPDAPLYARALRDIGAADPAIIVIDAGLATSMQTDLFRDAFPQRYVNLGIAEANAVGYASGLARRGFKPIVHSFANFLARRAHDQIAVSLAVPGLPVTLVGGSCGVFDGRNGPSHFAGDDLATFNALPGFHVYEPADGADLNYALAAAMGGKGPAYLRLRRHDMPTTIGATDIPRASVRRVHDGGAPVATIVTIGTLLDEALTAVRILADDNLALDLFHVVRVKPLDLTPILASAARSRRVIAIENHVAAGGAAQAICAALSPHRIRVAAMSRPDMFLPAGDPRWLLARTALDATALADRIASFVTQEAA